MVVNDDDEERKRLLGVSPARASSEPSREMLEMVTSAKESKEEGSETSMEDETAALLDVLSRTACRDICDDAGCDVASASCEEGEGGR